MSVAAGVGLGVDDGVDDGVNPSLRPWRFSVAALACALASLEGTPPATSPRYVP